MIDISKRYGVAIDIMIEAKHKERALFHLYEIYPELFKTDKYKRSNTSAIPKVVQKPSVTIQK